MALLLALVAGTVALFSGGLDGEFVYDDLLLIQRAPATQSPALALEHWMAPYYAFAEPGAEVQRGLWRPLTSLTLAVGRVVGGGEPFGFHAVSLLLHVLCVGVAYRLAARLLSRRISSSVRVECAAAVVALAFAIHPVQAEAVAWISAVNDPLWGLFGLLALLAYERAGARTRTSFAAPLFFFAALLAKEQAVVVLPLALLLDVTGDRRPRLGQLALMLVPLAAWYALRVQVFGNVDAGVFREHGDFGMTLAREATFRVELAGGFLRHAYWPTEPAVFRPVHPVLPQGSTAFVGGLAWLVGALGAGLVAWLYDRRTAAFGVLMLLVVVAPIVAAPDRAGVFPLSDRYLYLGAFGAALSIAAILVELPTLIPIVAFGATAAVGLSPITSRQIERFETNVAFHAAGAELDAPDSPYALWGAGRTYLKRFTETQDLLDLQTAYLYYLHSLRAVSVYGDGTFEDDESLPMPERLQRLEHLILETPPQERRLDPTVFASFDDRLQATLGQISCCLYLDALSDERDLEYPLALALQAKNFWPEEPQLDSILAQIHSRRGELEAATEAISAAIQRSPDDASYYLVLGGLLLRQGELDAARSTLNRAVELDPTNVDARLDLATVALESRRYQMAEREIRRALEDSNQKNVRALSLMAGLELERGRPPEAFTWIDRALALDPNNGEVHKQRGIAASRSGDIDGAIDGFAKACELIPDDYDAHRGFAMFMLMRQPPPEAASATKSAWKQATRDALVRAYMLSPPSGEEQLLLQDQIVPFLDENPTVAFNIAMELYQQGREVLSLFWLQRVVDWRTNWPAGERSAKLVKAFTTSGRLYLRAKNPDAALQAFRDAVLTDPNDFIARFELGSLLFDLGDFEAARPHVTRALELFPAANVAPEFKPATRGTLEMQMKGIEAASTAGAGPPPEPGSQDAGSPDQ